ncbi:molybdate ABC transporter substrate-binding protein [Dysosmobacter sp. Sow4_B12]|uniref:molybdate ABC transporter substrate-binding protein n=1 Tax=Dysosmobacter sp. Sow4_B12 TaxID=3438777 RepID=UPI003F939408
MKKYLSLLLSLSLVLALSACGAKNETASQPAEAEEKAPAEALETAEISVFAAASMQESLDAAIQLYEAANPNVTVVTTYDSSGTLLKQIQEGAVCDVFISAAPKQMNALDGSLKDNAEKNPNGLDYIVEGSRLNLLENKVTLSVPVGNPAGIESFDQLAELLKNGDVMLAMGNSDVPVGQYTLKIFDYYGIDEAAAASKLTYGSNVKEVTTQVSEGAVDCGIIYGTDAFSAGLTVVDEATAEMCGQVIYPATVLSCGEAPEAGQAFLDFLCTGEALACFEAVGFSPLV